MKNDGNLQMHEIELTAKIYMQNYLKLDIGERKNRKEK
jgi:hypothetical protein